MAEYISHPLIKDKSIERRSYQVSVAATALMRNTLVVLPTGLGKTIVAAFVIGSRLHNAGGRAVFLAPTKPLVEQHAVFLRRVLDLDPEKIISLSGETPPEKRVELWSSASIIVSTPQVVENDIIAGRIDLRHVTHLTIDEAHRAVGNYAYVFITRRYLEQSETPLILAITASPGSDVERIQEVMENLGIEEIEIRTEFDEDVKPYVHQKDIQWVKVDMPPELKKVRQLFQDVLKSRYKRLRDLDIDLDIENSSKKELLAIQETIQAEAVETGDSRYYEAVSIVAEVMKIMHAVELIETQGLDSLKQYLKKLMAEARSKGSSKAARRVAQDTTFRTAIMKASGCKVDHPKLQKLKEFVREELKENPDSRIIVFSNFRDTAELLSKELEKMEEVSVSKFIGQASRVNEKGMGQKQQIEILDRFREGEINVLVSTSVGEEGLDIPATDLVIFFEAVPSEIRAIQRRGRTGRARKGKIVVLLTKGTRDEGYYWSSFRKERSMFSQLYQLRDTLVRRVKAQSQSNQSAQPLPPHQRNLQDFSTSQGVQVDQEGENGFFRVPSIQVYADSREAKSGVVKKLFDMGIGINTGNLEVADYVLSDRVAVERKSVDDFIESLIKKEKLFNQLFSLKRSYQKPILLLEGDSIYKRAVSPNAVRGALAAITIDMGIPMLFTRTPDETAYMLAAIASREQKLKHRKASPHADKSKRSLQEQQEYLVASISNIGPVIARNLLEHFGTIENIVNASEKELIKVPNVGKKTAEKIKELLTTPYDESEGEYSNDEEYTGYESKSESQPERQPQDQP
ncbi:MAG: DEAD/DEAH box helicase [Archaeoglobaceae archaeon]